MNTGLNIFKKAQRYASGAKDVEKDVSEKKLAGSAAESAGLRQLYEKYGGMAPEYLLYPDFIKAMEEDEPDPLLAAGGDEDVAHLQGGTEKFMGPGAGDRRTTATTIGKWGDRLGPNSVAVSPKDIASGKYRHGQWIKTPRGWKQVHDTSWVKPGKPNPSGTIEYWLPKGGDYRGSQNTPAGFGPQQQFTGGQGVGAGQVTVGGGIGFAPGTYTGELGGPGDPGRSTNPLDYLNPFGGTSKGGSNTGGPTQRGVGMVVGTASNLVLPGLGFITGPLARWATSLIQGGMSKHQAAQMVQQAQAQGKLPSMPKGSVPLPTMPVQGGGVDPYGNPARGREYWSGDFGRGLGGPSLSSAGGTKFGQFGTGFGTGTVGNFNTAIGFGGSYGGGSNAGDTSRFAGGSGYNRPYTQAEYNTSPSFFGWNQGAIQGGPRASYEQYLNMFHPIGSLGSSTGYGGAAYSGGGPKGIGGGTPTLKPSGQKAFAMGTSSVNPGLKLFHAQLKRKKK